MAENRYRLIDIAHQINRDKSTIIQWEESGLIPVASTDNWGWRHYTKEEARYIVDLVKKTNYFKNDVEDGPSDETSGSSKLMYMGVMLAVAFILYQLALV